MLPYVLRRTAGMVPTLLIISFLIFLIIELPPGDYLSNQIEQLRAQGEAASVAKLEFLRQEFALDRPFFERYAVWLGAWPSKPLGP
ncbi:MAG: ABC transporter permease, partial [Pseudomonadota bacterium]